MKPAHQFCGSSEHAVSRRRFLQGGVASAVGLGMTALGGGLALPSNPACANELRQKHKQVILLWLAGGASQLETFDPKPGRPTGGPFRAIQTSVPGVHISELMPKMARLMHHVAVIRSLDTKIGDHGQAADLMRLGRRPESSVPYPDFGTVIAKELAPASLPVPEYVNFYLATEGRPWGRPHEGFLGSRFAAMNLEDSLIPQNLRVPAGMSEPRHLERDHLRQYLSERFNGKYASPEAQGLNSSYARVPGLMHSEALFDADREPPAVRDRFGPTEFGKHALIARRLIEAGVPMVKVGRAWWDSHADNFESHRELVTELDHVMSTLILDLKDRGLLESTLVITLSEFGRTPQINASVGRDHFASAWSCSLTGCGVKGGAVHGKTDADGHTVTDGKVGAGDLTATIYQAVGINPGRNYHYGSRPIPFVPEGSKPVKEVLA